MHNFSKRAILFFECLVFRYVQCENSRSVKSVGLHARTCSVRDLSSKMDQFTDSPILNQFR